MADTAVETPTRPDRGPLRKRRRIVISCTECHRRKQKVTPLPPPVVCPISPADAFFQCDRELPCANCRSRNRQSSCSYEPGAPTARDVKTRKPSPAYPDPESQSSPELDEPLSTMAASWGYGQTGTSTIGFLKTIETLDANPEDGLAGAPARTLTQHGFAVREKYKGLIRQLPSRSHVQKLIDMFMAEFNWQYGFVEPDIFHKQLEEWNSLPFSLLSTQGPQALSPDLRVFPAVLFQIVATALLLVPEGPDPLFDALKYTSGMTYEELAAEYSDSGAAVVNLFGKKGLSITTVQAEFLRASFLKFTANVTESVRVHAATERKPFFYSLHLALPLLILPGADLRLQWHMVAVAIRDAQELGMHRDSLDPRPKDDSLVSVLENQWLIQRRRKMYMMLIIW